MFNAQNAANAKNFLVNVSDTKHESGHVSGRKRAMLTRLSMSSMRRLLGCVLIALTTYTVTALAEVDASGDLVLPQSTMQAIQQETASTATAINNNIAQAQAQTAAEQTQRQQAQAALNAAPPSTNAPTLPVTTTTTTPKVPSQPLPPPPAPKAPTISDSSKAAGQETGMGSSVSTTPSAPTGFSSQPSNSGSASGNSKWDYGF